MDIKVLSSASPHGFPQYRWQRLDAVLSKRGSLSFGASEFCITHDKTDRYAQLSWACSQM